MGMRPGGSSLSTPQRHLAAGVIVLFALVTTAAILAIASVFTWSNAGLTVGLAAIAAGALIVNGALAYRLPEANERLRLIALVLGSLALGVGTMESIVRGAAALQGEAPDQSTLQGLAISAWVGRGCLTFAFAYRHRKADIALGAIGLGAAAIGIGGVLRRADEGLPSELEQVGAGLLAVVLVGVAIRWLYRPEDEPALAGGIALLSCGLGLAFTLGAGSSAAGDWPEITSLLWLLLAGVLSAVWIDRQASILAAEERAAAIDLAQLAEEQRVLLESTQTEQSIVRHDGQSSLTALEAGLGAIRRLHGENDTARLDNMTAVMRAELGRLRRLLERTPDLDHADCCVADVVGPLVALHRAAGTNIEVVCDPPDLAVAMSGDAFAESIQNLIRNCELHAPGSNVVISARTTLSDDRALICVADDGPGVPIELRHTLFDREVTTRDSGGLGLYAVRTLVRDVGGDVRLDRTPTGASFTFDLPAVTDIQDNPRKVGMATDPDDRSNEASRP